MEDCLMNINRKIWQNCTASLLFILVSLFLYSQAVFAENSGIAPPRLPRVEKLSEKHQPLPLTKIILGKLDVILETTTLKDILRSAGVGTIEHNGDASESQYWVCYTASEGKKSQRIWIMSGEMGGDQHDVDRFHVEEVVSPTKSNHCPELSAHLTPMVLGKSIWLGASQSQIKDWLGEPSATTNGWSFYSYSGKSSVKGFDESMLIGVRIINGKVVSLFASKTTSN
jgi:hypothetical protein